MRVALSPAAVEREPCEACKDPTRVDVLERYDGLCAICDMDDQVQQEIDSFGGDS